MSDLISREVVIDVLKQTGIIQDNDLGHLVVDEINRIPTAYDVEKVLGELKNPTNYTIVAGKHFTTVERSIEIVRKGGVE